MMAEICRLYGTFDSAVGCRAPRQPQAMFEVTNTMNTFSKHLKLRLTRDRCALSGLSSVGAMRPTLLSDVIEAMAK